MPPVSSLHRAEHVIVLVGIDHIGRAEALRVLAAVARPGRTTMIFVAPATRAPCTIEMPMPPAPTTSTVAPSGTLRRVEHRADAGLHRAADDARDVERRVVGHLDRAGLGGDHVLGEAAEADAAQHRQPVPRQRRVPVDINVPVDMIAALTQQPYSPRTHQ